MSLSKSVQLNISPAWGCKPLLSVTNLSGQKIDFGYYRHPPYKLAAYCGSQHLLKIFLGEGMISRSLDERSQDETVGKGYIAIIPARTSHYASWKQEIEFLSIALEPDLIITASKKIALKNTLLMPQFACKDALVYGIGLALLKECQHWNSCSIYVETLLTTLTAHLLRNYSNTTLAEIPQVVDKYAEHRIEQAIAFINNNLDRHLTLDEIAKEICIGKHYFCHLFSKYTNITPYRYILQKRVERAKLLIRQYPERRMIDIALDCGFGSQSHFNKQFRKLTGVTPTAYRQNICCSI